MERSHAIRSPTCLVQLGHSFSGPCSPGEEDHTTTSAASVRVPNIRTTILVHDVHNLIGERFPTLVRVGTCLSRFDGQAGV
jgi:hypothetical protein